MCVYPSRITHHCLDNTLSCSIYEVPLTRFTLCAICTLFTMVAVLWGQGHLCLLWEMASHTTVSWWTCRENFLWCVIHHITDMGWTNLHWHLNHLCLNSSRQVWVKSNIPSHLQINHNNPKEGSGISLWEWWTQHSRGGGHQTKALPPPLAAPGWRYCCLMGEWVPPGSPLTNPYNHVRQAESDH